MPAPSSGPTSPSLSDVNQIGRKALKWGIIFLVGYMVLKMLLGAFVSFWKATHPEPPPPPTVGFGRLPAIEFPAGAKRPNSYKLETATGRFPQFPDRAKVFALELSTPNLLADEAVRKIAARYDFVFEPEVLNADTYRWTRSQPLETTFEIDLQTKNFALTTDYLTRPELISNQEVPDKYEVVNRVKSYLSQTNLLPPEVATNSADVTYLKAVGGELVEAASLSDANFMQVDLQRYPVDGTYRMYTPEGYQGIISAVVTGALSSSNSIVELQYNYQPKDKFSSMETYPLRSVKDAWRELTGGGGYIVPAEADYQELGEAIIRNVHLGYYDSFKEQPYLQPIYVFLGDDGLIGYVSAVDPSFVAE
ncbi:MAG: hypothetical protein GF381_01105 [Candidatus Pacebacteria bacterium]|nr:hypothetical protein [Candidatus Paceibacterota bacterium]